MLCPIFTTGQTRDLTAILLKDSYKIARIRHLHPAYQKFDLGKVYSAMRIVDFDKYYKHENIEFKFLNAGHIPGSAMILFRIEGKKVLYSGDYKVRSTDLMQGVETIMQNPAISQELKDIDVLITESTYGGKIMPERNSIEEDFLSKIDNILKNGSVLVPVFALGRAQEMLLVMSKKKWPVPIAFDGLSITITKKILGNDPTYLNKRRLLSDMFYHNADLVKKEKKRFKVMSSKSIIIATSGMLQGGPVLAYLQNMWGNANDAIYMTGFQCKRTNGRILLDEGYIYLDGWKTYVKCHVEKFDFSGHSDDSELKEFIKFVSPKNLIINHGDESSVLALKDWAEKNTTAKVYAPSVGDQLDI
jgi:putative mRNA 3-end processing factor